VALVGAGSFAADAYYALLIRIDHAAGTYRQERVGKTPHVHLDEFRSMRVDRKKTGQSGPATATIA